MALEVHEAACEAESPGAVRKVRCAGAGRGRRRGGGRTMVGKAYAILCHDVIIIINQVSRGTSGEDENDV